MKKYFIVFNILTLFFSLSCSNLFYENRGNVEFSFNESVSNEIAKIVAPNINESKIKVDCGVLNVPETYTSKEVLLGNLSTEKFKISSVPLKKEVEIFVNVSLKNAYIYKGVSNKLTFLEPEGNKASVILNIEPVKIHYMDSSNKEFQTSEYNIKNDIFISQKAEKHESGKFQGWFYDEERSKPVLSNSFGKSNFQGEVKLYGSWGEFNSLPEILASYDSYCKPTSGSWEYIEFGSWPQSKLPQDQVATIIKTTTTEKLNGWDCYIDTNNFGYVKKGDDYYKIEPIKWRVLTNDYNGKKLLLAEKALDVHIFDTTSNVYANSDIRKYLNSLDNYSSDGFYKKAFTPVGKSKIASVSIDGKNDKVFLLNLTEATNKNYGFNGNDQRLRQVTDYTSSFEYFGQTDKLGYSGWWLRDRYVAVKKNVIIVRYDGATSDSMSYYIDPANNSNPDKPVAIVPAICLEP